MPRKPAYTKEIIIEKALELVRQKGIFALSARELCRYMGCSTSPIFSVYNSLYELKADVVEKINSIYLDYVDDAVNYQPAFKELGRRIVLFAKNEPNFFQVLLNHTDQTHGLRNDVWEKILDSLKKDYGLDEKQCETLWEQMLTFAIGLATLFSTKLTDISDEEMNKRLGEAFLSTLYFVRNINDMEIVTPRIRTGEDDSMTIPLPKEMQ